MIRTIRIGSLHPKPADLITTLRADQVTCTVTCDGMVQVRTIDDTEWYHAVDYATEQALYVALGWSNGPPPAHPLARDLLDRLGAYYDDIGQPRAGLPKEDHKGLARALKDWCGAGRPGARRAP